MAEELVQETFVRLWRASGRFDPELGSVRAFLFTLAHRARVDLLRRRPPQAAELPLELGATSDGIDDLVSGLHLREALATLPDHHRTVLELVYDEDLPQQAVAERLGIPAGTVKSRTFHALRALRAALTEEVVS